MGTDPWGFDLERQELARRLRAIRRHWGWVHTAVSLALLAVLLVGGSVALRSYAESFRFPVWVAAAVYLLVVYVVFTVLGLPFAYLGLKLDRRHGLSTQTTRSWLADGAKSFALGLGAVLVSAEVILWLLRTMPGWWWLLAWALGIAVSFVISFVAPVLLAPLFFRFRPLDDAALRARFEALAAKARVPVIGVFEMQASAKTRRANAAVMGFGRTRRIVITDTMLTGFTPEEIETVLAHELGHQRYLDPLRGLAVGAVVSLALLFLGAVAYAATYAALGFRSLDDVAGLPLLALYAGIVSTVTTPLELWWSRGREARADRFSLEVTRDPAAFIAAMVKLHDQNLGVANPKPWELWLHYSHPPGRERVELARSLSRQGVSSV